MWAFDLGSHFVFMQHRYLLHLKLLQIWVFYLPQWLFAMHVSEIRDEEEGKKQFNEER